MKRILSLTVLFMMATTMLVAQSKISREEYIRKYKDLVLESQEIYGIPASIKMAQALLESDSGNSRLVTEANNHFGIKCKKEWTGESITHDDDAPGECFRKYADTKESFKDHSEFLDKSPRYSALFDLDPTDYKGWAYGLKTAGYATNPKYSEILIKLIEEYQLYTLDTGRDLAETLRAEKPTPKAEIPQVQVAKSDKVDMDNYEVSLKSVKGYSVYSNNGSEFVVAAEGDTFDKIAKAFGMSVKKMLSLNDLPIGATLENGDPVYVKSKAKRANNGKVIHIVKQGDTMHSISQKYGIRLKNIASINRREKSAELSEGQQIRLM